VKGCEVAGCTNRATGTMDACGTVYVCDSCRTLIVELAGQYAGGEG
jgi:hypothetical protein